MKMMMMTSGKIMHILEMQKIKMIKMKKRKIMLKVLMGKMNLTATFYRVSHKKNNRKNNKRKWWFRNRRVSLKEKENQYKLLNLQSKEPNLLLNQILRLLSKSINQ